MLTIKKVLKEIGNKHLDFYRINPDGYYVFAFDDGVKFETKSVMVFRLNHLELNQWVDQAHSFLESIGEL